MPRVLPTAVDVRVDGAWVRGTIRTCEVDADGTSCSSVVSYGPADCVTTGRFPASAMRWPSGRSGCPAQHVDISCCG